MRKRCRGNKRRIVNLNAVEYFVFFFKSAQNRYGVLNRRLINLNGLETSFKGGVLFDILPVFIKGRCAYAVQFAAGKHRFKQISRVHCAVGFARAHNGMQFIDKHYDSALGGLDFVKHRFKALFKFAPVLGAGYKRAHIK